VIVLNADNSSPSVPVGTRRLKSSLRSVVTTSLSCTISEMLPVLQYMTVCDLDTSFSFDTALDTQTY